MLNKKEIYSNINKGKLLLQLNKFKVSDTAHLQRLIDKGFTGQKHYTNEFTAEKNLARAMRWMVDNSPLWEIDEMPEIRLRLLLQTRNRRVEK